MPGRACTTLPGTVLLPLIAALVLFRKERLFAGGGPALAVFFPFGATGFLIWFQAYIYLPHEW
ncbi:MAG: hypothetical protein ACM3VT_20370 [Solirubrobacterales bacterium]